MASLIKYWKEIVIVALLAALVLGNNAYESLKESHELQLSEISKLKENTTIVEKIVEVRPDGTKVVIDRNTNTKKETDTNKQKTEISKVEKKSKKNYGISVHVPAKSSVDFQDLTVTGSIRLFHTPIFGEVGYRTKDSEITAGLRIEF